MKETNFTSQGFITKGKGTPPFLYTTRENESYS